MSRVHVTIYSDGGCKPNPGPGGWATILKSGDRAKTLSGGCRRTTNNRMELRAVIEGFRALKKPGLIVTGILAIDEGFERSLALAPGGSVLGRAGQSKIKT